MAKTSLNIHPRIDHTSKYDQNKDGYLAFWKTPNGTVWGKSHGCGEKGDFWIVESFLSR